jgi:hypothetical protein
MTLNAFGNETIELQNVANEFREEKQNMKVKICGRKI